MSDRTIILQAFKKIAFAQKLSTHQPKSKKKKIIYYAEGH